MLFADVEPPRVEDILSPVCGLAQCTQAASGEIEMALAQKHALSGLAPQVGDFLLQCDNCSKVATAESPLMQCSRCKSARYCCGACLKAHWPKHKAACRTKV